MSKKKYDNVAYLMIAPAYSVFMLFVLIPIGFVLYYSVTNYNMYSQPDFIGLKNYIRMFSDEDYLLAVKNTIQYSLGFLIPQLTIGLLFAVLLNRSSRLIAVFRTAIYIPNVMSMVCVSMVWLWIYNPTFGLLNNILGHLGIPFQQWLQDPEKALSCIIVMSIWKSCGYSMVIYLSGLTGIPNSLYEAAKLDGANEVQQFFSITWPMLRPTTFFLLITGMMNSFAVFEQVNIMTGGGPFNQTTTIVHQIYRRGFLEYKMGYASSMAVVLLIFSLIVTFFIFKFGSTGQDNELS